MTDQQPHEPTRQTPPPAYPAPGAQPAYPAPAAPQNYPGQPTQPGYAPPAQPGYAPPAQPGYAAPGYAQPAQPGYPGPAYGAPTQPAYPAHPGYPAPAYGAAALPVYPAVPRGATSPDDLTLPLYGATFGQAITRFFKSYARFTGRASRSEFWWVQLFIAMVSFVAIVLIAVTAAAAAAQESATGEAGWVVGISAVVGIALAIFGLGIIVPTLAINWRRLHDANFAGPFWFLSFTYIGSLVVLVFTILPSNPQGQRFDQR